MKNSIVIDGFVSPDKLFLNEPRAVRAVAFEKLARDLHLMFGEKMNEIINTMMKIHKVDRIEATIRTHYYYQQIKSIYAEEASQLIQPLRTKLNDAMVFEKNGNIQESIVLYEELLQDAFIAAMPYERLRIIYTKQKEFQKAIQACQRYIEVLEMVKVFWNDYSNIRLIPKYKEHIKKLKNKIE